MIDREKVIRGLECCAADCVDGCPYEDPSQCCSDVLAKDALELIKELLKAQEPRVLTLEEALGSDICWIEVKRIKSLSVASIVVNPERLECATISRIGVPDSMLPFDIYGEEWRCWSARPTEEQRKAVPWDD